MLASNRLVRSRIAPSRRDALIGAAVVGGSLLMGACSRADLLGAGTPKTDFGPFGAFLKIGPDNVVTVINKHQEMGQGNHAGLAALVSEELDADWSRVSRRSPGPTPRSTPTR